MFIGLYHEFHLVFTNVLAEYLCKKKTIEFWAIQFQIIHTWSQQVFGHTDLKIHII